MKTSLAYTFSALALGGLVVHQAAAELLPAPVVNAPRYYSSMDEDFELTLDFPVPMVGADAVGKPVQPGLLKLSHADAVNLEWVSESRLLMKPKRKLPPLETFTLELPEGTKGLKGEAVPGVVKHLGTSTYFYGYSTASCQNGSILLRADSDEDALIINPRLERMYFELNGKQHKVTYRPLTVADALANWDAFKSLTYHQTNDEDREEASKRPADEVVPNAWILDLPADAFCLSTEICLPDVRWDREKEELADNSIYYVRKKKWEHVVKNTYKAPGSYELELQLDMPCVAATAEELVRQFDWEVCPLDESDAAYCPMEWRDGALRARVNDQEVVITPGQLKVNEYRMLDGSVKKGSTALILTAQTGGQELRLRTGGRYHGVYEGIVSFAIDDDRPGMHTDVTAMRPRAPYLYTDVCANHMQLRGSTTIRCRYGRVEGGKIRLWKLRGEPEEAVRLLTEYRTRYTGERLDWSDEEARKKARGEEGLDDKNINDHRIDTADLPGVLATAERPLEPAMEGEVSLPLAELFPGRPVGGFYMVEVEGDPLRNSKNPCFNQGIVQVTDLGLLWKTSGRHLFGWAYHLSTAAGVPAARLRLLDAAGKVLAELPVKDGVVQGDMPVETKFLQMITEQDSVIMRHDLQDMDWNANAANPWMTRELLRHGVSPADLPEPLAYLFSDRSLYRPGETAHVKGYLRWVKNNELLLPEVESITAELHAPGNQKQVLPVKLEKDGSFTVDAPLKAVGNHGLQFRIVYKGDADDTSPDKAVLKTGNVKDVYVRRSAAINLTCKEFRRNEFEVASAMSVDEKADTVQVDATATNFTTTPVANGQVQWNLLTQGRQFLPEQPCWREFRFGDYAQNPWSYYSQYYGNGDCSLNNQYANQEGTLDATGKGRVSFPLVRPDKPQCLRLVATTTVTNGNEQSIRSVQEHVVHPAAVYGGIRPASMLARAGGKLPVDLVAVKPDGSAWDGSPLAAEITVKRTAFRPYRYGSVFKSAVRNAEDETTETKIPVSLTGTPQQLEIPLGEAGRYDVELRGRDAGGREFFSSTRHYVWGDDVSPWEYMNGSGLTLLPEKDCYKPGEKASILVQTPVDAEMLVTVERGSVLRHFRQVVTVANPVIEVPLEAGDAPGVYVSVSLVQNAGARGADGKPLQKLGTCLVRVEAAEKILNVQLQAPQQAVQPGEECRVSGVITDAAGKPVANADVTLFAEDEGTLQVMGYQLPDPASYFYSMRGRDHGVATLSSLGQLVSENLGSRYFGNKGVFIGGGDDMESADDMTDAAAAYMRKDFNPCALWLSTVRTDARGRFTATYANPDTLTRYRLMAVAAAGDKFGAGEAAYHVTRPVMLEPAAPMSATEGDELLLPVTISMLPEELPEAANNAPIRWLVGMGGQNVQISQQIQAVTLKGKEPVTVHFPVKMPRTGPVLLQWAVQAENAPQGSLLARSVDAVQLAFDVVPATPYIREGFSAMIQAGQTGKLGQWIRGDYRPDAKVEVCFSTSPLAGIAYPLQYLFTYPYGCSEQLCSTAIPWIFREELKTGLGVNFPEDADPEALLAKVDEKLASRKQEDGRYSYWDDGDATPFSPYVSMIRLMMGHGEEVDTLRKAVLEDKNEPFMALTALAVTGNLKKADFETMLKRVQKRRKAPSVQEQWVLAYAARAVGHNQARSLWKKADKLKDPKYEDYHLPPVQALKCLQAIEDAPNTLSTAYMLQRYVNNQAGRGSTWRNAWMALSVSQYVRASKQRELKARLNGEPVTAANPQRYSLLAMSTMVPFKVEGNPVFVTGQTEGYLKNAQPGRVVDKGFAVQRRYEALQPDGSWKPTAEFRVGDVVRVTVSAKATTKESNLRYVVLEDRLPATFEVVDPALSSQSLPAGVSETDYKRWWSFPSVSNREFLKDRVRAFVDNWGNRDRLEVSYVARVVRSGKVSAPAAKAELMYRPEVHGLSIPQQFEVEAR